MKTESCFLKAVVVAVENKVVIRLVFLTPYSQWREYGKTIWPITELLLNNYRIHVLDLWPL